MQFIDHGGVDAGMVAPDASLPRTDAGADAGGDGGNRDGSIRID